MELGMTIFADITTEEYEARYLKMKPMTKRSNQVFVGEGKEVPETVDLRKDGLVSDVKN